MREGVDGEFWDEEGETVGYEEEEGKRRRGEIGQGSVDGLVSV